MSPGNKLGPRAVAGVGLLLILAPVGCRDDVQAPDFCARPVTTFDEEGIPVPPVHLSTPGFFRFGAHVPPGPEGVQVDIEDGQGTVSFDDTGPMRAFIFNQTDWTDIDRTLFQGLAVKEGAWFPFWLYCTDDGKLDRFWAERTDWPGWTGVVVDGTCAPTSEASTTVIDLPANILRNVALTCGFEVTTATGINGQVDLPQLASGQIIYPGYSASIFVFNSYDCRTDCGSRNWFELHSLMWDSSRNVVGFQIRYLLPRSRRLHRQHDRSPGRDVAECRVSRRDVAVRQLARFATMVAGNLGEVSRSIAGLLG